MSARSTTTVAPAAAVTRNQGGMRLQRQCDCGQHVTSGATCGACASAARKSESASPYSDAMQLVEHTLREPGRPLDGRLRAEMEPRFGHDFSRVRVHSDAAAAASARAVQAEAFTVGRHIVFGNAHVPTASSSHALLAHELAHVLQQGDAPETPVSRLAISEPGDAAEREADTAAAAALRGSATGGARSERRVARQATGPAPTGTNAASPAPAKQPPPSRPQLETNVGLTKNGFGHYSSELDRRLAASGQPCRLTLELLVRFLPSGPWPSGRFATWIQQFTRIVTDRWSFRFMLAPQGPCAGEPCTSATAILKVVPTTSKADNVMDLTVDWVKPSDARSNVSHMYATDVESQGSDLRKSHVTASHEAGHMLGLTHVHCDSNADNCYGETREESADVMGRGEIVTERDYETFAEAMSRHTGCTWKPVPHRGGPLLGSAARDLAIFGGIGGALAGGLLGAFAGVGGALALGAAGGALGALVGYGIGRLLE